MININDSNIEEETKEIICSSDTVCSVIDAINSAICISRVCCAIDEGYDNRLRAIKYWFCTGHCNLYGEILRRVFEKQSKTYIYRGHIVTKIGKHYYDARGILIEQSDYKLEGLTPYEYSNNKRKPLICNNFYKEDLLGNYDPETDDIIIKIGEQAGRECLNRIIIEKRKNYTHK